MSLWPAAAASGAKRARECSSDSEDEAALEPQVKTRRVLGPAGRGTESKAEEEAKAAAEPKRRLDTWPIHSMLERQITKDPTWPAELLASNVVRPFFNITCSAEEVVTELRHMGFVQRRGLWYDMDDPDAPAAMPSRASAAATLAHRTRRRRTLERDDVHATIHQALRTRPTDSAAALAKHISELTGLPCSKNSVAVELGHMGFVYDHRERRYIQLLAASGSPCLPVTPKAAVPETDPGMSSAVAALRTAMDDDPHQVVFIGRAGVSGTGTSTSTSYTMTRARDGGAATWEKRTSTRTCVLQYAGWVALSSEPSFGAFWSVVNKRFVNGRDLNFFVEEELLKSPYFSLKGKTVAMDTAAAPSADYELIRRVLRRDGAHLLLLPGSRPEVNPIHEALKEVERDLNGSTGFDEMKFHNRLGLITQKVANLHRYYKNAGYTIKATDC